MDPVIKKISADIKEHKIEIERLEGLRNGLLAYQRGAKRKGKKKAK